MFLVSLGLYLYGSGLLRLLVVCRRAELLENHLWKLAVLTSMIKLPDFQTLAPFKYFMRQESINEISVHKYNLVERFTKSTIVDRTSVKSEIRLSTAKVPQLIGAIDQWVPQVLSKIPIVQILSSTFQKWVVQQAKVVIVHLSALWFLYKNFINTSFDSYDCLDLKRLLIIALRLY